MPMVEERSSPESMVGRRSGPPGAIRGPWASGPVFEAPGLVAGFKDVAVVREAVEQIGRQDDRGALVKPADQVEQHLAATDRERQITKLVENDEIDANWKTAWKSDPAFGVISAE
jgi:hypothetical protein